MQIKCPNCGYMGNIADKLIPDEGRMVKCPKCTHSFFIKREDPLKMATDYSLGVVIPESDLITGTDKKSITVSTNTSKSTEESARLERQGRIAAFIGVPIAVVFVGLIIASIIIPTNPRVSNERIIQCQEYKPIIDGYLENDIIVGIDQNRVLVGRGWHLKSIYSKESIAKNCAVYANDCLGDGGSSKSILVYDGYSGKKLGFYSNISGLELE